MRHLKHEAQLINKDLKVIVRRRFRTQEDAVSFLSDSSDNPLVAHVNGHTYIGNGKFSDPFYGGTWKRTSCGYSCMGRGHAYTKAECFNGTLLDSAKLDAAGVQESLTKAIPCPICQKEKAVRYWTKFLFERRSRNGYVLAAKFAKSDAVAFIDEVRANYESRTAAGCQQEEVAA
jgi:hypothetical protein